VAAASISDTMADCDTAIGAKSDEQLVRKSRPRRDGLRKRPGFSEADLELMFRRLQHRAAKKREATERIPILLRERLLLINQMPSMSAEVQVAAGPPGDHWGR
jgi:hypothetical protein